MSLGLVFALTGAALAAATSGLGSARGVGIAGQAAAGSCTDNPDLFSTEARIRTCLCPPAFCILQPAYR